MSLRDAVVALRSLKAELEAIRRAKAEIEAVNVGLMEELRLAKQGQRYGNGSTGDDEVKPAAPVTSKVSAENVAIRDGSLLATDGAARADAPAEELTEAQLALRQAMSEKAELAKEAATLRESFAAFRAKSEEAISSAQRELHQALAARNEFRSLVEEAKAKAAQQEDIAAAAERQRVCAEEAIAILRSRLEATTIELESTKAALTSGTNFQPHCESAGPKEKSSGPEETVDPGVAAELANELRLAREAVASSGSAPVSAVDGVPATAPTAAREELETLRAELARVTRELQLLRESDPRTSAGVTTADENVGTVEKEIETEFDDVATVDGDSTETARALAAAAGHHLALLAEKDEEIESLQSRLTIVEEKLENADRSRAVVQTETQHELESLKSCLATAEERREAAERLLASEKIDREQEVSSRQAALLDATVEIDRLQASLAQAEGTSKLAALHAASFESEAVSANETVSTLQRELESMKVHSEAMSERLRLTEENAAASEKAAVANLAAEREMAAVATAARIAQLENVVRDAETDRDAVRRALDASEEALAVEAETIETERAAAAAAAAAHEKAATSAIAKMEAALKAREEADIVVREAEGRAEAAEKSIEKLKSQIAEVKKHRSEAKEEVGKVKTEERQRAAVKIAEVQAEKVAVEETLLMANTELQRLQNKLEAAQASTDPLRAEIERLTKELETLRATTEADTSARSQAALEAAEDAAQETARANEALKDAKAAETAAQEEISLLRKRLEAGDALRIARCAVKRDVEPRQDEERETTDKGKIGDAAVGEEDGAGAEADAADATRVIVEERDRLRSELRQVRHEAGVHTAALETQLADTEREAAETQKRLYRQQTQLENDLEELQASHDALRLEMARMDASMQDAAENASSTSIPSSVSIGGTRHSNRRETAMAAEKGGTVNVDVRHGKDATAVNAMGAEVGASVGRILRGKFWSGWGVGGGGREGPNISGQRNARGRDGGSMRDEGSAGARATGAENRGSGEWSRTEGSAAAAADGVAANREDFTKVRETMMARLQEAAANSSSVKNSPEYVAQDRKRSDEPLAGSEDYEEKTTEAETEQHGAFVGPPRKGADFDVPARGGKGLPASASRDGNGLAPAGGGGVDAERLRGDDGWTEETVEHPAPDYGLDSPVIRYLLYQWSADPEKLKYLTLWLRCVLERRRVPDAFPSGLQLVGLSPEIKDGFLTLVIPMIRHSGGLPVWVHSRRATMENDHSGERWDLRVKVELPHRGGDLTGDGSAEGERVPDAGGKGTGAGRIGFGRDGGSALSGRSEGHLSWVQDRRGAKAPGRWKSQASPR